MASVFIYSTFCLTSLEIAAQSPPAVSYDLLILILTYVRIQRNHTPSRLWSTLQGQGFLYFIFTSVVNIIAAVCSQLLPSSITMTNLM